jgi:DNA-directed RNA polymerase subunit RPC12/RpoP
VDEFAFSLLRNGIQSIREGDLHLARETLERIPNITGEISLLADAWYWMSETSIDLTEKRRFLETSLAYDLHHAQARRSLAILDSKLNPAEIINPDLMPKPESSSAHKSSSQRFVCPNCGGRMSYTPDGQDLVCDFCSRNQSIAAKPVQEEQDFLLAMATMRGHKEPIRKTTFKCQGCGAEFLLDPTILSSDCSYCGSAHVVKQDNLHELIEADAIIPMVLKDSQAKIKFDEWIRKNRVPPDEQTGKIRGIYLPVWSFDIGGHVPWNGERRENKKVVHIKGENVFSFNDLPVPASKSMANLLDKSLGDFDLVNAPAYDARYLAGWPAEVYQVSMAEASLEARQKASRSIERQIISKDGRLDNLNYSTAEMFIESFKLTLVPAWVSSYSIQAQRFLVMVNGQNGRVKAEMPRNGLSGWFKEIFTL